MTPSVGVLPPPLLVVNDHTGPGVVPPFETAVTRQKYVVAGDSEPAGYDGLVKPVATCGGGFTVPNATLYEVPIAPAVQASVGLVPTPVAASDGDGFDGAIGGPTGPAVVNDQIGVGPMSDGMTGVALVRETTFQ